MKIIETKIIYSRRYQDYVKLHICLSEGNPVLHYFIEFQSALSKLSSLELRQLLDNE
jgi:hypothetical protein